MKHKRLNLALFAVGCVLALVGLALVSKGFEGHVGRRYSYGGLGLLVVGLSACGHVLVLWFDLVDEYLERHGIVNGPRDEWAPPVHAPIQTELPAPVPTDTDTETGTTAHAVVSQLA